MAKSKSEKNVDLTTPENTEESVTRWYRSEEDVLVGKVDDAKAKLKAAEDKLQAWRDLPPKARKRKCMSKIRSTIVKPERLLDRRLKETGDDILQGVGEGLKMYRINRLLDVYVKHKGKLEEAVEAAMKMTNEYPDLVQLAGGFEWPHEISPPRDEEGNISVVTSEGVKSGKIVD